MIRLVSSSLLAPLLVAAVSKAQTFNVFVTVGATTVNESVSVGAATTEIIVGSATFVVSIQDRGAVDCDGNSPCKPASSTQCPSGPATRYNFVSNPQGFIGTRVFDIFTPGLICHCANNVGNGVRTAGGCATQLLQLTSGGFASTDWNIVVCVNDCSQNFGPTANGSWGGPPRIGIW